MAGFWDVIDAVGSFGSMVLAGAAGFVAYRLYSVESERDLRAEELQRQQAADRLRQQAAGVGFWHDAARDTYCVFNASSLPIYQVVVWRSSVGRNQAAKVHPALRPDELLEVPDGRKRPAATGVQTVTLVRRGDDTSVVRFADNANTWWERDLQGSLSQVEPPL
ncbi:hypothetical protein KBX50_27095 [Micromonospora sp. C51]|uniref:hypothetical protein n=1 Tax=Micromonospora sp. C51 TaxID=2824879 RepID=UPI001B389F50|nr:hypothetical protein [Micromonospora sp. C51]MBQ1052110.1 hypothetical protein [Micromonospora sp. C51]